MGGGKGGGGEVGGRGTLMIILIIRSLDFSVKFALFVGWF